MRLFPIGTLGIESKSREMPAGNCVTGHQASTCYGLCTLESAHVSTHHGKSYSHERELRHNNLYSQQHPKDAFVKGYIVLFEVMTLDFPSKINYDSPPSSLSLPPSLPPLPPSSPSLPLPTYWWQIPTCMSDKDSPTSTAIMTFGSWYMCPEMRPLLRASSCICINHPHILNCHFDWKLLKSDWY